MESGSHRFKLMVVVAPRFAFNTLLIGRGVNEHCGAVLIHKILMVTVASFTELFEPSFAIYLKKIKEEE